MSGPWKKRQESLLEKGVLFCGRGGGGGLRTFGTSAIGAYLGDTGTSNVGEIHIFGRQKTEGETRCLKIGYAAQSYGKITQVENPLLGRTWQEARLRRGSLTASEEKNTKCVLSQPEEC